MKHWQKNPPPDADPDYVYNRGKPDPRPLSPNSSLGSSPNHSQSLLFQAPGTVAGAHGVAQPSANLTYAQAVSPLAAKPSNTSNDGGDEEEEEEEDEMEAENTYRPKRTRSQAQIPSSDTDNEGRATKDRHKDRPKSKAKTTKKTPNYHSRSQPGGPKGPTRVHDPHPHRTSPAADRAGPGTTSTASGSVGHPATQDSGGGRKEGGAEEEGNGANPFLLKS